MCNENGSCPSCFLDAIASPSTYPCQSVGDSFRFGDSCRISELCELVYDGVPNLVCFAWPPGIPLRNMEIPSVWDFPLGAKILVFCPIPAQTHT